jgi:transposase
MAPNTEISMRALIITLKSPLVGLTSAEIFGQTGISISTINRIYGRAIERGFDPNIRPLVIKDEWLEDAPRSGRPRKQTTENIEKVVEKVRKDRYGREKSCADLAGELSTEGLDISAITIWRILKKAGFNKTKPTRKPGLTKKMKEDRLKWCIDHKDWTLEDWKRVIWSDETAVVLLHRRGGYRIWRKSDERFLRSCIRERWKGYSEFMFWGCFTYDQKGPCHCWLPETKAEKEQAEKDLEEWNKELEPIMRDAWELESKMGRLSLVTKRGRKPQWRWNKKNGKLVRESKGGIDWYRYQTKILLPKLFPFAKSCGPDILVQEDKAPSHAHFAQQRIYDMHQVNRLLWPGNSPDLNMIEPCWPWMKRETTKKGAPKTRAEAIRVWENCWKSLTQERIQAWVERIVEHVQQVIKCEGGNEYKEGRKSKKTRVVCN